MDNLTIYIWEIVIWQVYINWSRYVVNYYHADLVIYRINIYINTPHKFVFIHQSLLRNWFKLLALIRICWILYIYINIYIKYLVILSMKILNDISIGIKIRNYLEWIIINIIP